MVARTVTRSNKRLGKAYRKVQKIRRLRRAKRKVFRKSR